MSHFSRIKTRFASSRFLTMALSDLGIIFEEGEVDIRGFGGQKTRVHIRIRTQNPKYDIGFVKQDGVYMLVGDWFGLPKFDRRAFLLKLAQRYAYQAAISALKEKEFDLAEETVEQDGTIRLVLRRGHGAS
jgi:hypothetical protein